MNIHQSEPRKRSICALIAFAIILTAAGFQMQGIDAPYRLAYETAFQEQIARRHIEPGLSITKGISTITNLDLDPVYHPTHPPALQLILASLFTVFGDTERTARLVPLFSYLISLYGLWCLTEKSLSLSARLCLLIAFALCPLSFMLGRIVNFEPPVVACIVWTAVWIERIITRASSLNIIAVFILAFLGTLTDWTFLLFLTVLLPLSLLRCDIPALARKVVTGLWLFSITLFFVYAFTLFSIGALDNVIHHIRIQAGVTGGAQSWKLPLFFTPVWWSSLLSRLWQYGTPLLLGALGVWFAWKAKSKEILSGANFWCLAFSVFALSYLVLFSRASFQHLWCLFYFTPALVLAFGIVLNAVRWYVQFPLLVILLVCAYPVNKSFRAIKPNLTETQFGKVIAASLEGFGQNRNSRMNGPLIYTNRVDTLPYYANFDAAYFYLSIGASEPDNFLVRYRPEFVALSGLNNQTAFTLHPEDEKPLFERLQKSYTKVHEEYDTQLWESNWSPHVSLMGLLRSPQNEPLKTQVIEADGEVHIGVHANPGENSIQIDLSSLLPSGKRWLQGWAIVPQTLSTNIIRVDVKSTDGIELGSFDLLPQTPPLSWQFFRVNIGSMPAGVTLSWQGSKIIWGDVRLFSETLVTDDLTRILSGEIQRLALSEYYEPVITLREDTTVHLPVSQRSGVNAGSVEIPPVRTGIRPKLSLVYGVHPQADLAAGPVRFRLRMRDYPQGKPYTLLDDEISVASPDRKRQTIIDLGEHSRHLLSFTFETESPDGNADFALWYEARIMYEYQQ